MRYQRLLLIFTAFYLTFIGGASYYNFVIPVRLFHHLFITLLLAGWLMGRLRSGGLPVTPLNPAIFAAIAVWLLTALTSLDARVALEGLWFPLAHVVFFFIITDLLQRGRQKWLLEALFIMAVVVVMITALEVASWYLGLGLLPGHEVSQLQAGVIPATLPRVGLALNISTLLAGYVAPLIPVCVAWALTVRRRDQRLILAGLGLALAFVLLLTFSRGGWLSAGVALGLLALFQLARQGSRPVLIGLLAGAGLTVAMGLVVLTVSQDRRSGDVVRLDLWRSALAMIADQPVFGVGPGLYGRALRDYRDPLLARDQLASAHNVYLNTTAETGLLGALVSVWLAALLLRAWWRLWRGEASRARRIRLEAALAALIGVGVHSLVDVFTVTPIVLVILGLAAYCVTGHRTVLDPVAAGPRLPVALLLALVVGYAGWLALQINPAYLRYIDSLRAASPDVAREAAERDPALRLYTLQTAYATGLQAQRGALPLATGLEAYEIALALEPTWDTGWLNLAALARAQGDIPRALAALDRARAINPLSNASLYWAALADAHEAAADDAIIAAYHQAMLNLASIGQPPDDPFWRATPRRQAALTLYEADPPPIIIRIPDEQADPLRMPVGQGFSAVLYNGRLAAFDVLYTLGLP